MKKAGKTKLAKKRLPKKKTALKNAGAHKRQVQRESQSVDTVAFALEGQGARGQAGDLQGLSNVEGADSESVDDCSKKGTRSRPSWSWAWRMPRTLTEGKFARMRCRDVPAEHLDKES